MLVVQSLRPREALGGFGVKLVPEEYQSQPPPGFRRSGRLDDPVSRRPNGKRDRGIHIGRVGRGRGRQRGRPPKPTGQDGPADQQRPPGQQRREQAAAGRSRGARGVVRWCLGHGECVIAAVRRPLRESLTIAFAQDHGLIGRAAREPFPAAVRPLDFEGVHPVGSAKPEVGARVVAA